MIRSTVGIHYSVDCPFCGTPQNCASFGSQIDIKEEGQVQRLHAKKCTACYQVIYYTASLQIVLTASSDDMYEEQRAMLAKSKEAKTEG